MPCARCQCPSCRGRRYGRAATEAETRLCASIIVAVAKVYDLKPAALLDNRRDDRRCWARQIAYYLVRETTEMSYPSIGRYFGRDHSTVLFGHRAVARRMLERPMFATEVCKLMEGSAQ